MKKIKIIFPALLCFMIAFSGMAQEDLKKQQKEVEKNTSPFSLSYFNKAENSFFVISFMVENNKVIIDERIKIEEVAGKFPYEVGNFTVVILDESGEQLFSYNMQDPLMVRACGDKESVLQPMQKGVIHISVPDIEPIALLEFRRDEKVVDRLDLKEWITKYLEENREQ